MQPDPAPVIPRFLSARLRLFPRWLLARVWHSHTGRAAALTVLAVAVALAWIAFAAAHAPAGGCHWRVEGRYLTCERETTHAP